MHHCTGAPCLASPACPLQSRPLSRRALHCRRQLGSQSSLNPPCASLLRKGVQEGEQKPSRRVMLHATSKQAETEVQRRGQRGSAEQVHFNFSYSCAEGVALRALLAQNGEKAGIPMSQPKCFDACLKEPVATSLAPSDVQNGSGNGVRPEPPIDKLMTFLLFIFPALGGLLFGRSLTFPARDLSLYHNLGCGHRQISKSIWIWSALFACAHRI